MKRIPLWKRMIISAILLVMVLAVPALAGSVASDDVSNVNPDFIAAVDDASSGGETPAATGLADSAWPKYQYDLRNSGQSPYVGSQNSTPNWVIRTVSGSSGAYRSSNPVIGPDGTIYAIMHIGNLAAINPNGTVNWVRKPVSTGGRMAVALGPDGMIYWGDCNGNLLAIYPGNQTTKWQSAQAGTNSRGAPTVGPDGTIYMGSDKLYAYYPENGTERWSYPAAISPYGCPAIGADGAIYYAGESNIYALNPDGTLKWSNITGTVQGSPAIGPDGTIYVGSSDSNVYAWNPDGTLIWNYTTGGAIAGSPAISAEGTVYVVGNSGECRIYAINPNGSLKWTYLTAASTSGSPAIGADGTIYIGTGLYSQSKSGTFYAIDSDGTLKWMSPSLGDISEAVPAIAPDGTVYITSYNGRVYAFPGVVTFTADQTAGPAPLAVRFTGTSELDVTSWHWDFGDGATSTEQNPTHTYTAGGVYSVNLTITYGNGTNTLVKTDCISAYSPPAAGFTADPTSGNSPLSVTFTDRSTGAPTAWFWEFGDGTNSTEQNPTHTYTAAGTDTTTYTVNLTATNSAGSNTTSRTDLITLYSSPPIVSFTATPRVSAAMPLTVQFRDASMHSPTAWFWEFGDGTNSTEQNPTHTYAAAGTYTVNLTATNIFGTGTASEPGFIAIIPPGPLPSHNCINLYVANDAGVKYDEPNGVRAEGAYRYVPNTYYFASAGGLNALSLSADGTKEAIVNTRNQSGTFYAVHAGGQSTMPDGILMLAVNGTIPDDFSVHIKSSGYNWTPPGPDTKNYGLPAEHNYVDGAVDETFTKDDFIYGPQIWKPCSAANYPIYSGQNMSDTENAFRIMFIDLNAGATRDLPDGQIKIEYQFNNLTTFAAFDVYGWYRASNHGTGIIMTNNVGESSYMVTGIPGAPVANFTVSTDSSDISSPVQFNDTTENIPQSWYWEFGDGATSTEQDPIHTYTTPGTYTVNLTVTNTKGTDTVVKTDCITKVAAPVPVADFAANVVPLGGSPVQVLFSDRSTGIVSSWLWDFGDGITSTGPNPGHWYYAPGIYTVNLTVTNSGGSTSCVKNITVSPAEAAFSKEWTFESGTEEGFTGVDTWGDGINVSVSSTAHDGIYALQCYAKRAIGYARAPLENVPDASTYWVDYWIQSSASGYGYSETGISIVDANGALIAGISGGDTTFTDTDLNEICDRPVGVWVRHIIGWEKDTGVIDHMVYDANGTLLGSRQITRAASIGKVPAEIQCHIRGMNDHTIQYDSITLSCGSVADFTANVTSGEAPLAVQFTDLSTNSSTSWAWDFENDGIVDSTDQNPIHTYTTAGTYTVNLTVTNAEGSNAKVKVNYITVTGGGSGSDAPVANFTATPTTGEAPLAVQFTDTSSGTPTSWLWEFGDGVNSTEQNPTHTYADAGSYTINLTATNGDGSNTLSRAGYITVDVGSYTGVLPGYTNIYVRPANHDGIRWDYTGNNTYYINKNGGGLNAVHISTDPAVSAGQVTVSENQTGTFYVTDTGGRGYQDEVVLLLAVNGTIPDDFSVRIKTSGYTWTPNSTGNTAPPTGAYTYQPTALDETFTKDDFTYGPQDWKPSGSDVWYPIFYGQDPNDPVNQFRLAFIDTRAGLLGDKHPDNASLTDKGAVKVEYQFTNLSGHAAFSLYAWNNGTSHGQGMGWTNRLSGDGSSGYTVTPPPGAAVPVAAFNGTPTSGEPPLTVAFTDLSTGDPTAWAWDFGDNATSDQQNPAHTYASPGTYTVNLTVTNAAGSDAEVKTDYITVSGGSGGETPATTGLADSAWPKFGGDLNNSGLAPYVGTQSTTPKWEYDPAGGSGFEYSTPVIGSDGTIYIGTADWRFYAFNPDGTAKWIYNDAGAYVTCGPIYGSAAIGSDGTIYFGTASGETKLYALNPDGTLKWGSPTIGGMVGSPAIGSDGTVYAGSDQIYAFNPVDGTIKWSYPASVSYACPAIGADGTIYVGSSDANVYALNPDGTLKWNFTTGGEIQGSPAIGADGTIYIGTYGDNNVYALNPDGTLKWNFDAGGSIQGSPAIGSDGTIYIGTYGNNKVYALNPDGTQKWVYSLTNKVCGSLVIGADGTIYFVNKSRYLYALNPDGTLKFTSARLPSGSSPLGTPAIGPDGTVYFGTSTTNAKLYAFPGVVTGTADTTSGTAPLDVQFTGTSPLTVTAWHWDFGDGTTSTEQNPSHTYASAGTYTVNLTITHADGTNYHRQVEYIKVYAPPTAGFTANVTSGLFPLAVSFTDQSTGSPIAWAWDFENDGIVDSTEQNPEHTYTAASTYTVNLTVANAAGSDAEVKTDYITVSAPAIPRVSFTASHRAGIAPLTVRFADASSSNPTSWLWDFGDGNTSTEQNPTHTYTGVGTYTVSLTATNADGSSSITQADYIVVIGTELAPLPAGQSFNLYVANDEGVKYNVENGVTNTARYTPYVFIDNTYHFLYDGQGGGTNALHVSNDPSVTDGQVTTTTDRSGEFWLTFTGGQPNLHDAVLLLAVNGTIPDDFSVRIRSSGYDFEPPIPGVGNNNTIGDPVYVDGAINQTFTREDFIYGPQIWRPHRVSDYPIFVGQDMSDTENTFELMFIDLRLGCTQTKSDGYVKVEYELNNLTSFAVFNAYGWYSASNHGTGLIMTSSGSEYQVVGASGAPGPEVPVANFSANVTSGEAPLAVQFTDLSTGDPTAWAWDFENDGVIDSTEQSPAYTYATAGTYTVNLTVTNAAGSDAEVKTDYITVTTPAAPDLTVSTLSLNSPEIGEVFSAAENIYTAKITNIGTADAGAFAVEFNVSGVTGTVAVDGLAAGANTTVAWTDETVRTAGDPVTVTVTADADGAIAEADEENNIKTLEKTVVNNGYRGKRWTGGDDLETAKTYTVRGDLVYSSGTSAYRSAGTGWTDDTVTWTAGDLAVPENATITAARLYVPYTWDKGPVFPANVTLTFNGEPIGQEAFYADEKLWGTSYPYGMTVYDVTGAFSTDGNTAVLANTYPGGGTVSVRGMLLAVVYDDGVTAPHTILINEGFDLLYGGEAQSTTPEQATAYAPFALENPSDAVGARLVTVAPGAGPTEGGLLFNDERFENVWNYTGTTQIGVDDRDVTAFLAGENLAGFRSDADYMEAAAAFLVVEYAPAPGSLAVTSTPTGAAVWLDGTDTGLVTGCTLPDVPAGDHVVTLKRDGYADASAPVTVVSGETAEVTLDLTTLTGSLAVTSTPEGAAILIDGADTGKMTDTTLDGIAVGLHTVTLRKDGYVDTTAELEITYNETATLHLDLIKAIGSIVVTSAPEGAAIFLDGVDTGKVTNATLTAPAGEHTVTVTKPGYADATATVTVGHDQTVPVHFALTVPTGSILVTSTPDGARILLDGLETGEMTNATLVNVPAGDHTVRVERDGYREAEAAVTVTAGGTAPCHLDLEKIVVLPVADFSASVTAGTAPLTVLFTDASTGDPTSWVWAFGDGTTSTEQNPIYTYLAAGTYTVSLRVTNEDGSNSTTKPDYIAVTVLQGDQTQEAPLDIPGCNVTTGNDGKAHLEINTTEAGAQVTGNRVTIPQETYTLTIETEGEPGNDNGTVTGTVARIRLDTQPVITELDAIGTVSASVSANLTGIPAEAALTTTVSRDVAPDARSAFQLAASDNGLNLGDVAYTLNIARTNLENTQDIAGATIRMTVSPAWVEAHGGADAIRIIRFAGDTQEVLSTWFVGTDAGGNLVFEADSPNGFSVFGLATVSAVPQPSSSRSSGSGSGGSQASVGAAGYLKAGDRVVLAMDRTAISAVTFTAKNEVSDVMVTMAKSSLPRAALPPTGTVYQYIEATLYKAAAEDFSSVQFRFAVPTAWLAEHGCTKDEVRLFRLTDDGWREVPVEVLGEENGNAIFAASPEGFSLFAITATGKAPVVEEPTLEPIESETTPPVDVTTPPADKPTTEAAPTPLPVGIAVLALGVSLLLVRRRT